MRILKSKRSAKKMFIFAGINALVESMERRVLLSSGSVTGAVFNDLNGDGVRQAGESGLASRTVFADLNNNGTLDATEPSTMTDASGNYALTNVPTGPAVIRQIRPATERQTFPTGGLGEHVTLGSVPVTQANFGTTSNVLIAGSVFSDTNHNGVQDSGETGISGAVVYADLNNDAQLQNTEPHLFTSPAGKFTFANLAAGTYTFRLASVASGHVANPIVLTLASGAVNLNANIAVQTVSPPPSGADTAGNLDVTFGGNEGYTSAPTAAGNTSSADITTLPNGQYLLFTQTLQRYNSDGTLDSSFGVNGSVAIAGYVTATYVQPGGDVIVAGIDRSANPAVAYIERLLPSGKIDTSFGSQGTGEVAIHFGFPSDVVIFTAAILPLPSGQFVVGGTVDLGTGGDGRFALQKFNANGTVDNSFGGSGTGIVTTDVYPSTVINFRNNSTLSALTLTPDGHILASGFSSGEGPPLVSTIARYTSSGILDTSFGQDGTGIVVTSLGQWTQPLAIRALPSGQFMVAGELIKMFGAGQGGDAYSLRYNANGMIDSSYDESNLQQPTNDLNTINSVIIYGDGSILFGGSALDRPTFGALGGGLFRMNADGTPDTTFNGTSAETHFDVNGQFVAIALTSDQRILALASDIFNSPPVPNPSVIARFLGGAALPAGSSLAADGTLNVTGSAESDVITVDLSGDGKSIIATVNGISKTYAVGSVKHIRVDALNGDDSVNITSRVSINSTIYGGLGNDTLSGGSGADLLFGNDGDDVLRGNGGNDTMYGAVGDDTLDGGLGNDYFSGGAGNNTADYSNRTENLSVHIGFYRNGAKGEDDFLSTDIETLIGGSGNDNLNANLFPMLIVGGGGNDTLISGHGHATLLGGLGDDTFQALNNRHDTIDGGAGNNSSIADAFDAITNVQHMTT